MIKYTTMSEWRNASILVYGVQTEHPILFGASGRQQQVKYFSTWDDHSRFLKHRANTFRTAESVVQWSLRILEKSDA